MHVCTCVCVLMCMPTCVGNIAQREHTRQLHSTVESSGSNILAEWTSNLPNDLRAVKDIAANSNCKKYIGFRRGMAFGRLCFKTMLGERKVKVCSSPSEIITLGVLVQNRRCGEKLRPPFLFMRFTVMLQGNSITQEPQPCTGTSFDHAISLAAFFSLQF